MTIENPNPLGRIGLCWGCVPGLDLFGLANLAARYGFGEISATPGQYLQAKQHDSAWRDRLDATGVRVGVVDALVSYLPGSPRPADVAPALRAGFELSLQDCVEAADALGARALNVAHFLGKPADLDEMAGALREVADAAAAVEVTAAVEFIPGTGIPDFGTAFEIVHRAGGTGVGVMFDTWHFVRSGGVVEDLDGLAPGRIVEAQVSGGRPPPDGEVYQPMTGRLPLGEGDVPTAAIVRRLRAVEPDVVLGLEVFPEGPVDPDTTVSHLATTTRTFMEEL